jgi:hypothetical protein
VVNNQFEAFVANAARMKAWMTNEVPEKMTDWLAFSDQVGTRSVTDEVIKLTIDACHRDLISAGRKALDDYATAVKGAHIAWRQRNPK